MYKMRKLRNRLKGVILQRCPVCRRGPVFRNVFITRTECPECGHVFGRDFGYFTGAMYVSYTLAVLLIIPVWAVLFFTWQPVWITIVVPIVMSLIAGPMLWRYSRVAWMYLDQAFDLSFPQAAEDAPPAPMRPTPRRLRN